MPIFDENSNLVKSGAPVHGGPGKPKDFNPWKTVLITILIILIIVICSIIWNSVVLQNIPKM